MTAAYTNDTLINGASAGEWRLELHQQQGGDIQTATLLVRNTEHDCTVLEEDFTFNYAPIFGVDVDDLTRAELRAEEAITAWEDQK